MGGVAGGGGVAGCKVSLAAIPLWRYVIQLILHDPVACAFCTRTILHLYRHSLIVIRLVHPVSFQYKRDSIVLGHHSKNKVKKRSHLTHFTIPQTIESETTTICQNTPRTKKASNRFALHEDQTGGGQASAPIQILLTTKERKLTWLLF